MKRYLVQTFGCQMNVHDSRRIEELLDGEGYTPTDDAALADLVLVNTCSVREKAEHKLMSLLGRLRPLKETRPSTLFAVAGCVAQQEGQRLMKKAPYVDLVLGPDNIPELPSLLRSLEGGAPPMVRTEFDDDAPEFLVARPRADVPEVTAFVTTMKGCDERCTYCVVPYTRGSERYRPADDIVAEVRGLAEGGVREITLLGQTVNSWFDPREMDRPRGAKSDFAGLLRRIAAEVPNLLRLRYTSPHPRHLTDALIEAHRDLSLLPDHVHLPAQSGSDRVLRRMLRRYTRDLYLERVDALREACPGLTLSTDLIVGFPGETDSDFEETLSFVRDVGFVAAFAFKYSPRPYTPALQLGDDVPETVKDERLSRLFDVVAERQVRHLESLVGRRVTVLIEKVTSSGESHRQGSGRSERHEIVHVALREVSNVALPVEPGALVEATVERANKHSVLARMERVVAPAPGPRGRGSSGGRRSLPLVAAGHR